MRSFCHRVSVRSSLCREELVYSVNSWCFLWMDQAVTFNNPRIPSTWRCETHYFWGEAYTAAPLSVVELCWQSVENNVLHTCTLVTECLFKVNKCRSGNSMCISHVFFFWNSICHPPTLFLLLPTIVAAAPLAQGYRVRGIDPIASETSIEDRSVSTVVEHPKALC